MAALFAFSQALAAVFWILMIAAPGWRLTQSLLREPWPVAGLAGLYVLLLLPQLPALLPALSPPTLEGVAPLLGQPAGATLAWIHLLTFDLFVGRWIYWDARARGRHPLTTALCLVLTLAFGPLGLLAHLALRGRPAAGGPTDPGLTNNYTNV